MSVESEQLGQRIKGMLKIRKLSQQQVCTDLNIPNATMSTWVRGVKMPPINKLRMLAEYLGIDIAMLLSDNMKEYNVEIEGRSKPMLITIGEETLSPEECPVDIMTMLRRDCFYGDKMLSTEQKIEIVKLLNRITDDTDYYKLLSKQ